MNFLKLNRIICYYRPFLPVHWLGLKPASHKTEILRLTLNYPHSDMPYILEFIYILLGIYKHKETTLYVCCLVTQLESDPQKLV